MAALNTLRTKGGVALAVIIGISLIAFLLGDLTSSSSTLLNSSSMNVGEVDGSSVSYQEYQARVDELMRVQSVLTGAEVTQEEHVTMLRNQAWEQLVRSRIFDPQLVDLGLSVYDEEALDMADGEHISPILQSIFTNPQVGGYDQNMMRNFVNSLDADPSGNSRFLWNYLENQMSSERSIEKYMVLVTKGMFVTDFEVSRGIADTDVNYSVEFVTKSFSSVADSLVTPTDAQLKEFYNKNIAQFNQVEGRDVEYVSFDALPSTEDYAAAEKYIKEIADEFRASEDLRQFVSLNSLDPFNPRYMSEKELQGEVAEFAFTEAKGAMIGPIFNNDVYNIYRIADIKEIPDSVGARHIILAADQKALADSIATVLKSGKGNFAELVAAHSLDQSTAGGDLGHFDPQLMPETISAELIGAAKGEVVVASSPYGLHVMEVTYRSPAQKRVQIANVVYNVEPSNQTQQKIYSDAVAFASSAKSGDFNKAVTEGSLSKRVARLYAGDRNINGIDQSTEIVRWAFDSEKGTMSEVFTIGDMNIIAYVAGERKHGKAPFDSVKGEIAKRVTTTNKEAYIAKEMSGAASLEALASKVGGEVQSADNVTFNMFYIPEVGVAPSVIGAIAAQKEGGMIKPTASMSGMVVAKVTAVEDRQETTPEAEKVLLTSNSETQITQRAFDAIFRDNDIRDMRIRFF